MAYIDEEKFEGSEEPQATHNKYRDEVVMESLGEVDPDSAEYIEEDDDLNAIAEGYK